MKKADDVEKARVLIVDESAAVRAALSDIVASAADLEVAAVAADPLQAARCVVHATPDVIALDVEMLQMDGRAVLRQLIGQRPIPVVIYATRPEAQTRMLVEALAAGAVDVIATPRLGTAGFEMEHAQHIHAAFRAAAAPRQLARTDQKPAEQQPTAGPTPVALAAADPSPMTKPVDHMVVVGASTGGPAALQTLLESLPEDCPPLVAAQHLPSTSTRAFAERLNSVCRMHVEEARSGQRLCRGQALIAPGGIHTLVIRRGAQYVIELKDGPRVTRHKPSIDVLFRSAAHAAGANAVGVILTGMGDDGALGLKEMRTAGARTIGQDEATSIVYGMPKAAFESGAVQQQAPLEKIAALVLQLN